ncbi:MAG TPA: UbiA family prenyltransferase [Methanomassiliicoccales archaeon]|jgi:1,4-dihydroxy-2-naphthoate octaprenyltransferase|nr:UbiA family prenyltransferase [Methanomassiliicoccales archaeon]
MDPRVIIDFARIKPLMAWSMAESAIGLGLALYLTNWHIVAWLPTALAILAVVLIQWVAHPLNDIMDYDLDRQAPIESTARIKPIVDGRITMNETKWLTRALLLLILVIMIYLIAFQPVLVLPAAFGVGAMLGYSSKRLRLAYHPYSEFYLAVPINAIAITVVAYVGSGQLTWFTVLIGVVFGFAAGSFFLSMMSMDFPTDRLNGKMTTVVSYPRLRTCTYYPVAGLVIALAAGPFLIGALGPLLTVAYAGLTTLVFAGLIYYGRKVDDLRLSFLDGKVSDPEGRSGPLRLGQLYIATAYGFVLGAMFALVGVV